MWVLLPVASALFILYYCPSYQLLYGLQLCLIFLLWENYKQFLYLSFLIIFSFLALGYLKSLFFQNKICIWQVVLLCAVYYRRLESFLTFTFLYSASNFMKIFQINLTLLNCWKKILSVYTEADGIILCYSFQIHFETRSKLNISVDIEVDIFLWISFKKYQSFFTKWPLSIVKIGLNLYSSSA